MSFVGWLFGRKNKNSSSVNSSVEEKIKNVQSPTKINTVYSFVEATITLDLETPMGEALVMNILPYACQQLRQGDPEFDRLYCQVERENSPHVLGTGTVASAEGFSGAFFAWLQARGINISDPYKKKKIAVFSGNAQDPQNGLSFAWSVYIYFDLEN